MAESQPSGLGVSKSAPSPRERVRALGPMIDASAAADEDRTELAAEVVQAIDNAGIFSRMVPSELGDVDGAMLVF